MNTHLIESNKFINKNHSKQEYKKKDINGCILYTWLSSASNEWDEALA